RAMIQLTTYQEWISRGLSASENLLLEFYTAAETAKRIAGRKATESLAVGGILTSLYGGFTQAITAMVSSIADSSSKVASAERNIQAEALQASHDRSVDEWTLQSQVAAQNSQIGRQEVTLAQDRTQIVQQEKTIAETQASQARDTIEFLGHFSLNA